MSLIYHSYSEYYDLVFSDRSFESEIDEILMFSKKAVNEPVFCDMRCGTALHLAELSERGHPVVGVDYSEAMVNLARDRLSDYESATVIQSSDKNVDISPRPNVITNLFSSICHTLSDTGLQAVFHNYWQNLQLGGLLILDMTKLSAVPEILEGVDSGEKYWLRTNVNPVSETIYEFSREYKINTDDEPVTFRDEFTLRYFQPEELASILRETGFEILKIQHTLGDLENRLVIVARAVSETDI